MINYRDIFNVSYSFIGVILMLILILFLIVFCKKKSFKVIGYSFFGAGIFLLLVYFLGNVIVDSFRYGFFVNVITNSFFSSIVVFSILGICLGCISIYISRYVR